MTQNLASHVRKEQILDAALVEAQIHGYKGVTREAVALRCGLATGTVTKHLGTMVELKRSLMRAAVTREILPLIAQGLADRNPHALKASPELKARALQSLT